MSSEINLRDILQWIPQPPVIEISMNVTSLRFHSNLPGANELVPNETPKLPAKQEKS